LKTFPNAAPLGLLDRNLLAAVRNDLVAAGVSFLASEIHSWPALAIERGLRMARIHADYGQAFCVELVLSPLIPNVAARVMRGRLRSSDFLSRLIPAILRCCSFPLKGSLGSHFGHFTISPAPRRTLTAQKSRNS
jgi:hypothetical protein